MIGWLFLDHSTLTLGLLTSHSKMAADFSGMAMSFRGETNSTGDSTIKKSFQSTCIYSFSKKEENVVNLVPFKFPKKGTILTLSRYYN